MGSSVKLVTKDELTTGNYFNADNLIGGENTTIVKDGNVYKINSVGGSSFRFISEYDTAIGVGGDATYINIGGGANQIITIGTQDTASNNVITEVWADDFIVHTFGNGSMETGNIKLYGNITDKNDNEIFGLTSDNAGDNITITGSGSTLKINAAATASYPHITDSDNVTISVNGSSNTFAFTADNISSLNTLIANRESYLTQNVADGRYANKTELNYKQDQLTSDNAGNNITITGSGSTLKINAEATASYPHITDSDNVTISVEGASTTFSFTSGNISALNTLVSNSGNYLTQSTADARYAKTTDLSNKQDQLTSDNAGDNITITGSGSTLKINAAATVSYPHISDGDNVIISAEGTSGTFSFTSGNISSLNTLVSNSGNYLTQTVADGRYAKTVDLTNKQDKINTIQTNENDQLIFGPESTSVIFYGSVEFNYITTFINGAASFEFNYDSINTLNRIVGKDFIHLTSPNWGTMEDGGVYYVDMISDSGPFNFQTGLSMAAESGKVYTAELHIHYNENIDSPVWPDTWQWVDEDDVTQPTPVPSGSNGKWICYTIRSVNGFTLVHLDHIYGTAS